MSDAKTNGLQVCQSLLAEHRLMEGLLEELQTLLAGLPGSMPGLRILMGRIAAEMEVHFACEERVLFPVVARYHPMDLMEAEHVVLMALRDEILACIEECSAAPPSADAVSGLRAVGTRLVEELLDHIGREDAGIFPACERCLPDDRKETVARDMQALRSQLAGAASPGM